MCVAPMIYLQPYDITAPTESPFDNISVAWGVLHVDHEGGTARWLLVDEDDDDDDNDASENSGDADNDAHTHAQATLLLPHGQLPEDFWRQVSRNTEYTLHVEELAAENFVLSVTQEQCADPSKPRAIFDAFAG